MGSETWIMIARMSALTIVYLAASVVFWKLYQNKKITWGARILIGVVFGGLSILSTHFGANYGQMVVNVRDVGPLAAGLFFDPISGIIAGFLGGIERYLAAEIWSIGIYSQLACSLSTMLAGFLGAFLSKVVFHGRKPNSFSAFFVGAVMEVFHMYAVFFTHADDLEHAFQVVRSASIPMIIFTAVALALLSILIRTAEGERFHFFRIRPKSAVPVSQTFQRFLLIITLVIILFSFFSSFMLQTKTAEQDAGDLLAVSAHTVHDNYNRLKDENQDVFRRSEESSMIKTSVDVFNSFQVGSSGTFDIVDTSGSWIAGNHERQGLTIEERGIVFEQPDKKVFEAEFFGKKALCWKQIEDDGNILILTLPFEEVYSSRDEQAYETALADIILFAVLYAAVYILVQQIVVRKLKKVNNSLGRITNGNLDEVVDVRSSSEFNFLSDNINTTVSALKGYISDARKRMQQDLESARIIQESALPRNFAIPRSEFSLYASMKAAKVVGGDFYDFFAIGPDRMGLVIADVSGKGIPASLFMMRSKTLISNMAKTDMAPADILYEVNNALCEGNEAEMFVTAWIGIIDITTGVMTCANAGHEYPVLMRAGGEYEILKDKHGFVLAGMEGSIYKEYKIQMNPGDRLFVYTDGVPEAINTENEQYGTERLCDVLNTVKQASAEETLEAVEKDMNQFVGEAEQFDDITMLGFFYNGNNKSLFHYFSHKNSNIFTSLK